MNIVMYIIINNLDERVFPINLCKTLMGIRKRISRMLSIIIILTFEHRHLFLYTNNTICRNKNIFILVTSVSEKGKETRLTCA